MTFIPRFVRSPGSVVLKRSNNSEVGPPIVKTIVIDMVDLHIAWRFHNKSVEIDGSAILLTFDANGVHSIRVTGIFLNERSPFPTRRLLEVIIVNQSDFASGQL